LDGEPGFWAIANLRKPQLQRRRADHLTITAAGEQAVRDNEGLTPQEQLAVALQAAAEALEGVGLALAEDGGQAPK
jgi:hypothetical protein